MHVPDRRRPDANSRIRCIDVERAEVGMEQHRFGFFADSFQRPNPNPMG
jgi:hypothetical protein